ncbi:MAG: SpoIIIAC/SpoIIIAD family protein [Lachnospiraceae bacterium]|nr:SpoIIIAC/SpoIIIAD family protein [Lachnospiraceae bacterium]MDY4971468.1 SpoIIIAC/SpoIIIAD family protein [Lachnospiraceae bacterium]
MIQIILAGAAAAMLALWVRPLKPEYGIFLSLGAMLLLIGAALSQLDVILDLIRQLMDATGLEPVYFRILLKIMGLAWISQLASDICKEAGCGSISRQIDIYGKLLILSVSLPVITALIETIETLFAA